AREQAASCQRVLKGYANIAYSYATKRYRSNLLNWGLFPFTVREDPCLVTGEYVYIPGILDVLNEGKEEIYAYVSNNKEAIYNNEIKRDNVKVIKLYLEELSKQERDVLKDGCMINYYRNKR
ncbi:MAG: hydratase, partial [Clostridia bacterium]